MNVVEKLYALFSNGHSICTDSRAVKSGDIFFALKGENFNGNLFAQAALGQGAVVAVVDDENLSSIPNILIVPNVLECIQQLAKHHRLRLSIPIIGLTGSNGKTTTKELINVVLKTKFKTFATQGNLNNHIGVPLSILSISSETEIAVIEMGANHVGEIAQLCSIAMPTHGLITNIGKAHLGEFGGFEGVKKAKSELYTYLKGTNGSVFLNDDNALLKGIVNEMGINNPINYGSKTYSTTHVSSVNQYLNFDLKKEDVSITVSTNLVGSYNAENILAAICIGEYFGVPINQSVGAIAGYTPTNNRSQAINTHRNTVILDAYNANPSSMELAIRNFAELDSNKPKVAILGEMLELGEYTSTEHSNIFKLAQDFNFKLILVGKNFELFKGKVQWFENQGELAIFLKENPVQNAAILLKGSRGVKLDKLMEFL